MPSENIPVSSFSFYNSIKQSYSGGHVDLYRPYAKGVYVYDVNSLYPYVMSMNKFPVVWVTPQQAQGGIL